MRQARLLLAALAILLAAMVAITVVDAWTAGQHACTQPGSPLAGAQECAP